MKVFRKFYLKLKIFVDLMFISIISFIVIGLTKNKFEICSDIISFDIWKIFFVLSANIIWYYSSKINGLYDEFKSRTKYFEFEVLIRNVLTLSLFAILFQFITKLEYINRTFVVLFMLSCFLSVFIWKIIFNYILKMLRMKGRNIRNIYLIGNNSVSSKIVTMFLDNPEWGYNLKGYFSANIQECRLEYLGTIDNLKVKLNEENIDEVILATSERHEIDIKTLISICEQFPIMVRIIPDYSEVLANRFQISLLYDFPIITVRRNGLDDLEARLLKRTFDIVFSSLFLLTIAVWFFPLLGLIIKLNSPGPIFFKQERWGKKNKPMICYKFRSMKADAINVDANGKLIQATQNDKRVTRLGKFLRKSNIDELPQFINVFLGEMSVVGPRPHPTPLNYQGKNEVDKYLLRHLVKPGITGWAQVHGYRGNTADPDKMNKRIEYDIWYFENWNFLLDLKIIYLTVKNMIIGEKNAY